MVNAMHCCIQKMWLGGKTESFQNVGGGGGKGVYNVLTFQKSRGANAPSTPLNETLLCNGQGRGCQGGSWIGEDRIVYMDFLLCARGEL